MIPSFNGDGNLPPDIHQATVEEIGERFAHNPHRMRLFSGLLKVVSILKECECREVYLNGSFVTNEPFPNDYDLCWEPTGIVPTPELKAFLKDVTGRKVRYLGDIFIRLPQAPFYVDHVIDWQKDRDGKRKGLVKIIWHDHD